MDMPELEVKQKCTTQLEKDVKLHEVQERTQKIRKKAAKY